MLPGLVDEGAEFHHAAVGHWQPPALARAGFCPGGSADARGDPVLPARLCYQTEFVSFIPRLHECFTRETPVTDPPNFPIVIGVTGHRDIAPALVTPIRNAVLALLEHWRFQFGAALYVMTALADGADQLVADAAESARVPIIAIAPLPVAAYRATLNDRDKFDHHWMHARLRLVLPEVPSVGKPDYHERQYEQLGVLLIRRSHLLLALWDGVQDPQGRSGTGAVMRMRLEGDHLAAAFLGSPMFLEARSYLDETNRGPLLHVVTPRHAAIDPSEARTTPAGACFLLGLPDQAAGDRPQAATSVWNGIPVEPTDVLTVIRSRDVSDFDHIDKLNRKISSFHGADALTFDRQVDYLNVEGMPPAAFDKALGLIRQQAGADTAAQTYQGPLLGHFVPAKSWYDMIANSRTTCRIARRIPQPGAVFYFSAAVPLAVLLFELFTTHRGETKGLWSILGYLLVLGGATAYYKCYVEARDMQSQFQDYRALAEAMRVQLYWAIAAIPAAVSDHYLHKQSGELGWIQFALRGPALWAAALAETVEKPRCGIVMKGWIDDQAGYFNDKWPLHHDAEKRSRRCTKVFLYSGILVAAALLLIELLCPVPVKSDGVQPGLLRQIREYEEGIALLAAALPAVAGFYSISRELRAYEPHAPAYALMHRLFSRATEQISAQPLSDTQFQDLVRELGREALSENAEWLTEHRHRKIEQHS
jgi:hypothetical protein